MRHELLFSRGTTAGVLFCGWQRGVDMHRIRCIWLMSLKRRSSRSDGVIAATLDKWTCSESEKQLDMFFLCQMFVQTDFRGQNPIWREEKKTVSNGPCVGRSVSLSDSLQKVSPWCQIASLTTVLLGHQMTVRTFPSNFGLEVIFPYMWQLQTMSSCSSFFSFFFHKKTKHMDVQEQENWMIWSDSTTGLGGHGPLTLVIQNNSCRKLTRFLRFNSVDIETRVAQRNCSSNFQSGVF